jgi:protease I
MAEELRDRTVAILAADGVERVELDLPRGALYGAGAQVEVLSIQAAVEFVRAFVETGKPVASVCHGPWTLAEADVIRGRHLTSWESICTDLRNAGAEVVDEEVCIDGQFTTSRSPFDLPAFCAAIVVQFAAAPAPA